MSLQPLNALTVGSYSWWIFPNMTSLILWTSSDGTCVNVTKAAPAFRLTRSGWRSRSDFTRYSHHPLPLKTRRRITLAGYRVYEALAISEVLYLQEQEDINAVIIDSNVEQFEQKARQFRGSILKLKPEATSSYVQWELSLLFPNASRSLQYKCTHDADE